MQNITSTINAFCRLKNGFSTNDRIESTSLAEEISSRMLPLEPGSFEMFFNDAKAAATTLD